jgi:type II secretory pathway pseudopilin PulG
MVFNHHMSKAGMTLVEVVVVCAIYTVLLIAITSSVVSIYQYNSYTFAQADEVENARRGIIQWNRDVKEMITGENGTFPVAVIQPYRLGYYSDTDLDDTVEYIEYVLASTTLTKYTYNPTGSPATYGSTPDSREDLSYYVQNIPQNIPIFTYYDNVGTQLNASSSLLDVRYISAQIIVNIDPARNPGEFMLESSVAPRNLKDNL